ncbi:MAG: hypothetical protein MJ201_02990 [Mycoplasmoidaceae bacterium]|nr:hypothetical protein [Mycoplasmoidaceae bacterium]
MCTFYYLISGNEPKLSDVNEAKTTGTGSINFTVTKFDSTELKLSAKGKIKAKATTTDSEQTKITKIEENEEMTFEVKNLPLTFQ